MDRRHWLTTAATLATAAATARAARAAPTQTPAGHGGGVAQGALPLRVEAVDRRHWRIPGEFEPQRAIWLGYDPALADTTRELAEALAPHTPLRFFVGDDDAADAVTRMLAGLTPPLQAEAIHVHPLAMYYLRDAVVFARGPDGRLAALDFRWTQYGMPGSCRLLHATEPSRAARCVAQIDRSREALDHVLAEAASAGAVFASTLAMEGGGIESNGQGLLIANAALVRQRNPELSPAAAERLLLALPGVRRVIWLADGLAEDPLQRATITGDYVAWGTGGHTDEFVRFADARTVLLAWPDEAEAASHPVARLNLQRMRRHEQVLAAARTVDGAPLRVRRVPMPRIVERRVRLMAESTDSDAAQWSAAHFSRRERRREGSTVIQVASASYLNFVIANGVVVLPDYTPHGTPPARQARVKAIFEEAFPGRALKWVDPLALNWLGGGLHCATLHEPAA